MGERCQAVNAQGQSDGGCIDVTDVKRGQLEVGIGQFDIPLSSLLWAWRSSHGVFFIKNISIIIMKKSSINFLSKPLKICYRLFNKRQPFSTVCASPHIRSLSIARQKWRANLTIFKKGTTCVVPYLASKPKFGVALPRQIH